MKRFLLSISVCIISLASFAQSQGPNNAGTGYCNSSCLACSGSIWNMPTNIYLQDNNLADVGLTPSGNCFQSTCYYSRFLWAYNFGFSIPGTATVLGVVTDIYRQSGNVASATDSTVKLGKTNAGPLGMNKANPNPWSTTAAYYTYGNATDLWGSTWTPAEINAVNFGLWLKVYNMSTSATTPTVDHIRITVYYSTSTGTFSQTSTPSTFNAYQNENELEVSFISNEQIAKGSLKIFNMMGEMLQKKELTNLPAGANSEKFEIGNLAAGIYFIQFDNGISIQTKKVLLHD